MNVQYIPVHLQHYYRKKFKTGWGDCPNAEAYYKKCLSIPLFPARQIGWACECGERLPDDLECLSCGKKYKNSEDGLKLVSF